MLDLRLDSSQGSGPDYHEVLVIAISRAHRWKKMLDDCWYGCVTELARVLKMNLHYLPLLLRLTLLAPDIIDARERGGMSIEALRQQMPLLWGE